MWQPPVFSDLASQALILRARLERLALLGKLEGLERACRAAGAPVDRLQALKADIQAMSFTEPPKVPTVRRIQIDAKGDF